MTTHCDGALRQSMPPVPFGACYVYSPGGVGQACGRSRLLRSLLKAGDARFITHQAACVREQITERSALAGFFGEGDILVPVPGSAAGAGAGGGGEIANRLASALLREGLGCTVWRGLLRVRSVRRSSTAGPGLRPSVVRHYDSFAVDAAVDAAIDAAPWRTGAPLVLIDDVVTKGRTLLAAAMRLYEAFPAAEIRAFALLRTMGPGLGVRSILEPCVGEIRWRGGDAQRTP